MSDVAAITAQLYDKLSDLVVGFSVQGTLYATSTSGTVVVPQGTLATLSDGRLVRVRKSTRVTTTPTPVPTRIAFLTPGSPVPHNFVAVGSSTTLTAQAAMPSAVVTVADTTSFPASGHFWIAGERVDYTAKTPTTFTGCTGGTLTSPVGTAAYLALPATFVSPPTGITAACDAASFGSGALSSGLRLASLAVHENPTEAMTEVFAAGAQGDALGCLYAPQLRRKEGWSSEKSYRRETFEVKWRLRCAFTKLAPQKDNSTLSQLFFDAMSTALIGATVGSWVVRVDSWEPVRRTADDGRVIYEALITAYLWSEGRTMQPVSTTPFAILGIDVRLSNYDDAVPGFRDLLDITVASEFSSDFSTTEFS